jgi:hypothetical protein
MKNSIKEFCFNTKETIFGLSLDSLNKCAEENITPLVLKMISFQVVVTFEMSDEKLLEAKENYVKNRKDVGKTVMKCLNNFLLLL